MYHAYQYIIEKIEQLKARYQQNKGDAQDVEQIDAWMGEARRLILLDHLAAHAGIRYIREVFQSDVESINAALLVSTSKELPDIERDRMIDRRTLAEKYLGLFVNLDEQISALEATVDSELANPMLSSTHE